MNKREPVGGIGTGSRRREIDTKLFSVSVAEASIMTMRMADSNLVHGLDL